jgi:predicted cupin superfamily sugar epimerase
VVTPGPEPDAIARELGLEPLPEEGGLFRRTYVDAHSSAIYFLLVAPDFSALHRLTATETYHFHAGSPLRMLLLDDQVREPLLGPDVVAGQRPQIVVPAGTWQGSSPTGAWTLLGTTTAPPFDWSGFTLGRRAALVAQYPAATRRIEELTRG